MRIVEQDLEEHFVKTLWEDGSVTLELYKVDMDGNNYVDIDPNNEIFIGPIRSICFGLIQ